VVTLFGAALLAVLAFESASAEGSSPAHTATRLVCGARAKHLGCSVGVRARQLATVLQAPTIEGTATIPGSSDEVDYNVTATPVPDTTQIQITYRLSNHDKSKSAKALHFILCSMVQTTFPNKDIPQYEISFDESSGRWKCTKKEGTVSRPPSYHFGCRRITIPPGQTVEFSVTSAPLGNDVPERGGKRVIQESDLLSAYFDILRPEDGVKPNEPEPCSELKAPAVNVNVHPPTSDFVLGRFKRLFGGSTANFWGGTGLCGGCHGIPFIHYGTGPYQRSQPHRPIPHPTSRSVSYSSTAHWEIGNWVTMSWPRDFPVELIGEVKGLPPNSTLTWGVTGERQQRIVSQRGRTIALRKSYTIEPDDATKTMAMTIESTSAVEAGHIVAFDGIVAGRPGNVFYRSGQFVYGFHVAFVSDFSPPAIEDTTSTSLATDGSATISATASDSISSPAAASVVYEVNGGPEHVRPLGLTPTSPHSANFSATLGPFARTDRVAYQIQVVDTHGNLTVGAPRHLLPRG